MRRSRLAALLCLPALAAAAPAEAASSWAKPQIRVVVEHGLMGPSVQAFRPGKPLTRGDLDAALTAFTGQEHAAADPDAVVPVWQLDRALVGAAGLRAAAAAFQQKAEDAGLAPPARFGTEVVARLLGLRPNHPAAHDDRELRPQDPATRAEAAYSFARLLATDERAAERVTSLAEALTLPELTAWQRRVLARAAGLVGMPYVWGGASERKQTRFGVTSRGGFDCSGFVGRVYRLRPFAGAPPELQAALRGRTTYAMSGEFPRRRRISRDRLRPGDVVFFGARGPLSRPAEIAHMGIYAGGGWFLHSSGNGTTMTPLAGWYADTFAWGRRPLREAGLA